MKWWKLIIVVCIIGPIVLFIFGFIGNPFLPIYQTADRCLIVDGVKYSTEPLLKWDIDLSFSKQIGYDGSWSTRVYEAEGDPDRNFISIRELIQDMPYMPLHRMDKAFPEPSAETVDKMVWADSIWKDDTSYYEKTIVDKGIIKEFFQVLRDNEKEGAIQPVTPAETNNKIHFITLTCYSSQLQYASYFLNFGTYENKLVCTDSISYYNKTYCQVPKELLEKIAGRPLQIDGYQP